jgi:hypothetical protein
MPGLKERLDKALPVGNEGAGIVVEAGSGVQALVGRTVAARSQLEMYAQYRVMKASDCLVLPDGVSPREGASAMLFLAIRACRHFFLGFLENILTFYVLLRKKLPRQPLHNRLHNRGARLHITIHRHPLGP